MGFLEPASVRGWSNEVLRRLGRHCRGRVINVSGWRDEDKQGGHYRDYFPQAEDYRVSNYGGVRGESGLADEIWLDITGPLPQELAAGFDVVLSHTVLEHIYDVQTAMDNLCALSRDLVIVVVPFAQHYHPAESYGDFWRFSLEALETMFARRGFAVVTCDYSSIPNQAIYVVAVASRQPERWQHLAESFPRRDYRGLGESLYQDWRRRLRRLALRFMGPEQLSRCKRAVLGAVRR